MMPKEGTWEPDLQPPRVAQRAAALAYLLFGHAGTSHADYAINLPPPATGIARQIYDLHTLILWICAAILIVVFVPMVIALVRHRRSAGHVAHRFHDNLRLEILWTAVPVLILVGMAYPATKTVIEMKDWSASDMTIKIVGRQWKWEYDYVDDDLRFISTLSTPRSEIDNVSAKNPNYLLEVDRPLVIPTGAKIKLILTASDVIHAWWIPAFGVKQDAVPGFIRETWFRVDEPGTYRGQCAELCGVGHGFMPIVVEAVSPERFESWKTEQRSQMAALKEASAREYTMAELVGHGEKVYAANCAVCHQANGAGVPPAFPPLDGSKLVAGPAGDHLNRVFNGRSGTAMQAFGPQLSDFDIAAVVTFERNSWSNRIGDVVQPAQVAALRKQH
ncbi:MAG TPA: cytochrome c oxidase subunit II [Rhodocyclaceae bacterium]|nr:cytochrome c oxidase subunit II [Rhodocyclaceae bacterium]HNC62037.1 cytochrome c oxidase subunit II [Rhodocyclaceae bacterium]HNH99722.1 cytochrome c oxidase subunit II [Rhodocyclaceae bacterium]